MHSVSDSDIASSARKRRKSASGTPVGGRSGSPLLKPALTERQQMALIMQMTDPQRQGAGKTTSYSRFQLVEKPSRMHM